MSEMNEKKPLYRVILLITLALYAAVALLLRAMAPDWIESLWLFLFCIVLIVLTELRHGFSLRIPRACLLGAALMAVSAFFSFLINSQTLEGRPIGKVIISLLYFLFYALLFQSLGRLDHIAVFGRPERVRHLSPRSILRTVIGS